MLDLGVAVLVGLTTLAPQRAEPLSCRIVSEGSSGEALYVGQDVEAVIEIHNASSRARQVVVSVGRQDLLNLRWHETEAGADREEVPRPPLVWGGWVRGPAPADVIVRVPARGSIRLAERVEGRNVKRPGRHFLVAVYSSLAVDAANAAEYGAETVRKVSRAYRGFFACRREVRVSDQRGPLVLERERKIDALLRDATRSWGPGPRSSLYSLLGASGFDYFAMQTLERLSRSRDIEPAIRVAVAGWFAFGVCQRAWTRFLPALVALSRDGTLALDARRVFVIECKRVIDEDKTSHIKRLSPAQVEQVKASLAAMPAEVRAPPTKKDGDKRKGGTKP